MDVIARRAVLLAGVGAGTGMVARRAAAALPVPANDTLAFRMIRHGSDIGRHTLTFEPQGDMLNVHVAVDAKVTLLSIPIAHYTHRSTENWQGETLVGITGRTNKNGQQEWVDGRRTSEGLVVIGSHTPRYIAPEQAIGVSYWNKRMLSVPMISMEDGVLLRPKVAERRTEPVLLASGSKIPAEHYNISGQFSADVWYDQTDAWASLALTIADGSEIRYERL